MKSTRRPLAIKRLKIEEKSVRGHHLLTMENTDIRTGIDLTRGAHVFELLDKRTGRNLLYSDPKGIFDYDVGGWYELFPNAGRECSFQDSLVPAHGDIKDSAWQLTDVTDGGKNIAAQIRAVSDIFPLELVKTIGLDADSATLFITETVTNIGQTPHHYMWGHHVTFSSEFAVTSRTDLPSCRVVKRADYDTPASRLPTAAVGPVTSMPSRGGGTVDISLFPSAGTHDMLFTERLDQCWYNVYNSDLGTGFALAWDRTAFPYLWIWQDNRGNPLPPFNGDTVGLALEPQSSDLPMLSESAKAGKAHFLLPGASTTSWLTAVVHADARPVAGVDKHGHITFAGPR